MFPKRTFVELANEAHLAYKKLTRSHGDQKGMRQALQRTLWSGQRVCLRVHGSRDADNDAAAYIELAEFVRSGLVSRTYRRTHRR